MSKFKEAWDELSTFGKISTIIAPVLSIIILTLCVLGFLKILPINQTNTIVLPILAVLNILIGINLFRKNKVVAIFIFASSAFIFIL